MSYEKEYTLETKPNNLIVKAAKKKGLTNFTITWRKAMSRMAQGWYLKCDQIPHKQLGYDQKEAIARINNLVL